MRVKIKNPRGADYIDITDDINGYIKQDDRLDEALDSCSFEMITSKFTSNIPPFTKCVFEGDNGVAESYWFASSSASVYPKQSTLYRHQVTLVEPTKILETWEIGSKCFTVIDGKLNYNQNKDRVRIIKNLIEQRYGVTLNIYHISSSEKLKEMREYKFGSGTSAYDVFLEIFKTENLLPRILGFELDEDIYFLGYDDIGALANSSRTYLSRYMGAASDQSVDEYCSEVVTEMDSVVDRDTIQTVFLSCRTANPNDPICKDNAALVLPTNCEEIVSLAVRTQGPTGKTLYIPSKYLDFSANSAYNTLLDKEGIMKWEQWVDAYVIGPEANEYIRADLKTYLNDVIEGDSRFAYVFTQKDYAMCQLFSPDDGSAALHVYGWSEMAVIDKDKWDLLTVEEQTANLYYISDSNSIGGFYNTKNSDFWNKLIFGEYGPYFAQWNKRDHEENYVLMDRSVGFFNGEEYNWCYTKPINGAVSVTLETDILVRDSYHMHYRSDALNTDPLTHQFRVRYIAKSPFKGIISKTSSPINQSNWTAASRSYNNGAQTVDYNQLAPAMQRSADMQGLVTTSISSDVEYPVGTRFYNYGYVISRQKYFRFLNDQIVIKEIVYNCCNNYQQIAAAIGTATQYEATNIPKVGIIPRYVYVDASDKNLTWYANVQGPIFIGLASTAFSEAGLAKQAVKLNVGSYKFLVIEALDNYAFDKSKEPGYGGYYKNGDVAYCDSQGYAELYSLCIAAWNIDSNLSRETLDKLPKFNLRQYDSGVTTIVDNLKVYKDPKERLIFVIRI